MEFINVTLKKKTLTYPGAKIRGANNPTLANSMRHSKTIPFLKPYFIL